MHSTFQSLGRARVAALAASVSLAGVAACGNVSSAAPEASVPLVSQAHAATGAGGAAVMLKSKRYNKQGVPNPGVELVPGRTALVVTDPQNDFLSPQGVTWGVVGKSVEANHTVENLEQLLTAANDAKVPVFVSPHYYFPHDHGWGFAGGVETMMHGIKMFDRSGALTLDGFEGSGADWLDRLAPFIERDGTVVTSPHKVYGPETNDLVLQLRKRGVDKVILAGMSANLCVEAHMRELVEQGFEVAVVGDATAAAQTPAGDGYAAALVNFRYIAGALVNTDEAVQALGKL